MKSFRRATAATLMTLLTIGGATALSAAPAEAAKSRVETITYPGYHYGSGALSACLTGRTNVDRWPGTTILTGCYPLKSAGTGTPTTYAFQFSR
ncbi:hypothetical protein [Aeromicrobium sp. Leaf350]|uniref:hypothetical protein n=1 Tax=Aeromicrobium sp. Leaf350 TaxID=2876565 RepID=UPI001E3109AE|nr:hypothetical protein [Aeromicrobium sp. Leaf350]